jgi:hypothetical protein
MTAPPINTIATIAALTAEPSLTPGLRSGMSRC